jgi:hypothetical protein
MHIYKEKEILWKKIRKTDLEENCTRRNVRTAEKRRKFLSSLLETDLSTVGIAIKNIGQEDAFNSFD